MGARVVGLVCGSLLLPTAAFTAQATIARATTAPFTNWARYLFGSAHSSDNIAATAITAANAAALGHDWTWTPAAPTQTGQPAGLLASPTVVNGVVYIGANTGVFYALSESTGHVIWHRFLGYVTNATCGSLGIVSTATVTQAPGGGPLTVYVAGGDGHLYALNAATGAVDWKSVIALPTATADYFDWSSPTVVNGNVYVGVSSECDAPLVVGGEKEFSQATGALEHFYQTYPGHSAQPSIWSSSAVDASGKHVFVTTGNGPGGDAVSVVRLDAATLARQAAWQVPAGQHGSDSDFGGSPTLFTATLNGTPTPMVGACNKNGTYYALRQGNLAAGPVWSDHVAAPYTGGPQCDAAAIWGGAHLYVAGGNKTTINGVTYPGSLRKLNPATGAPIWQRGLAGPPIGSPTMDGAGVIGVTEYGFGSAAKNYTLTLINANTGAVLRTITIGPDFGQPVFADDKIFTPSQNHGLIVYRAPAAQWHISFVAAADVKGNQPTETVTVPAAVSAGDAMLLIASGSSSQPITAPSGWAMVTTKAAGSAMVTSVWRRVATSADPGRNVTVTFGTTYRKGDVQLLAYSGTSATAPVLSFATGASTVKNSKATTPTLSVTGSGDWVVSGWATKSSDVTAWTAPAGQVVRNTDLGAGRGRIDMLACDAGKAVAPGSVGGLTASTDQPFTADTTLTLVLAPAG